MASSSDVPDDTWLMLPWRADAGTALLAETEFHDHGGLLAEFVAEPDEEALEDRVLAFDQPDGEIVVDAFDEAAVIGMVGPVGLPLKSDGATVTSGLRRIRLYLSDAA